VGSRLTPSTSRAALLPAVTASPLFKSCSSALIPEAGAAAFGWDKEPSGGGGGGAGAFGGGGGGALLGAAGAVEALASPLNCDTGMPLGFQAGPVVWCCLT
jgi:hypothetical protein